MQKQRATCLSLVVVVVVVVVVVLKESFTAVLMIAQSRTHWQPLLRTAHLEA